MSITLGSNIASLQAQRQLFRTDEKLGSVFERLSSGQRINRASDDAAGLAISESLNTDRRVFNQAIRNLNNGLSVLNIADSTVAELSGIVTRIQELAEQAANGSLSSTQRESLDAEAQELKDEFFRVSRSADFNGLRLFDGSIEDGIRLQAGYGTDGSIFSSLGGVMGDGSFQGLQTFGAGFSPVDSQLANLNNDGSLDVVAANRFSGDVTVLLGNGDGSFQSVQSYGAGDRPFSVMSGDVNGDGKLDLVTANYNDDTASVLLGNGNGTFQQALTLDVGDDPRWVDLADFDNDGVLDVVTINNDSDDITILLGLGDGTFSSAQSYLAGSGARSGVIGDVDADGNLDIFAANHLFTNEVTLLLGNGDGSFQSALTLTGFDYPRAPALGDLNGDGALDLFTANYLGDDSSVLLGRGDGTFRAAETFQSGNNTRSVDLGDLDGDGVLDVVLTNTAGGDITALLGSTREGIAPILDFSLETQADALQAIAPLSRKLQSLSEQRGTIGAFQSRLQSALNTLSATSENYAAAESRIKDADIAFESSQLTRLNILQQAASAVLGQANQQPALALTLLQ